MPMTLVWLLYLTHCGSFFRATELIDLEGMVKPGNGSVSSTSVNGLRFCEGVDEDGGSDEAKDRSNGLVEADLGLKSFETVCILSDVAYECQRF